MTDTELLDWLATHPTHVLIHDTVKGWEYSARDGNRWQHEEKDEDIDRDGMPARGRGGVHPRPWLLKRAICVPVHHPRPFVRPRGRTNPPAPAPP